MKLDIKKLKFEGIDGQPLEVKDFEKTFANTIFMDAKTIPVHEKAKDIYKGKTVDVTPEEAAEMIAIVEANPFRMFVQAPLLNFLKTLK